MEGFTGLLIACLCSLFHHPFLLSPSTPRFFSSSLPILTPLRHPTRLPLPSSLSSFLCYVWAHSLLFLSVYPAEPPHSLYLTSSLPFSPSCLTRINVIFPLLPRIFVCIRAAGRCLNGWIDGWMCVDVGWEGGRSDSLCVAVTDIKIFLRRGDSGDPGNDRAR